MSRTETKNTLLTQPTEPYLKQDAWFEVQGEQVGLAKIYTQKYHTAEYISQNICQTQCDQIKIAECL